MVISVSVVYLVLGWLMGAGVTASTQRGSHQVSLAKEKTQTHNSMSSVY